MTQQNASELEQELRLLVERIKCLKQPVDRVEYKRLFVKGQQIRLHLIRMNRMAAVIDFDTQTNALGFIEEPAVKDSNSAETTPAELSSFSTDEGKPSAQVLHKQDNSSSEDRSAKEFVLPMAFLSTLDETSALDQANALGSVVKQGVTMKPPTVFLQYAHVDATYKELALALANRLRADGVESVIDQYEISPPEGWAVWMTKKLRDADFVLVLCSEDNLKRFDKEQPPPKGTGATWEGHFIQTYLLNSGVINNKFVPVLLRKEDLPFIPAILQTYTHYAVFEPEQYDRLFRFLTKQPEINAPPVSPTIKNMPPRP